MSFLDKLAKIEALIQRASSEGERQAAQLAKERVINKISLDQYHEQVEYRVSSGSRWEKRLFVALCQKHGFQTYRYERQKFTTTRLKISKNMMDEILWPDYVKYSALLRELIEDITRDVIDRIHKVEDEVIVAGELGFKEGEEPQYSSMEART